MESAHFPKRPFIDEIRSIEVKALSMSADCTRSEITTHDHGFGSPV